MNKINVLLINTATGLGGGEIHTICQYKALLRKNYNTLLIVPKNSKLAEKLKEEKLDFYSYTHIKYLAKIYFQPMLNWLVYNACKKHSINIIHCSSFREVYCTKKAVKSFNIKVIATRHTLITFKKKYIKKFDGIICVNNQTEQTIKNISKNTNHPFLKTCTIPPFFNEKKFINFKLHQNKNAFFLKEFNTSLPNCPTICMVANFYKDLNQKNHSLLFKAIYKLRYEKNKKVNVLLCGEGPAKKTLQILVRNLKIESHVYFLGFTEKIREVLFYSDINILTGRQEGFGISMLEASLLKKPLIGPTNTGAENTVIHEETGLLFKNNNSDDLANQIEKLIDNPKLRQEYGENACRHIKNNFLSDKIFSKLEKFYRDTLNY